MEKVDAFTRFWQIVSTVSTGGAIRGLVSIATADEMILGGSFALGLAIGGTVAFKVIPELVDDNHNKQALILGAILSLTYPLNSQKAREYALEYQKTQVDSRYQIIKKEYDKFERLQYSKDSNIITLKAEKTRCESEVSSVKNSISLQDIRTKIATNIGNHKSQLSKSAYKRWYTTLAKQNGCRLPIGFSRLRSCVSQSKYNLALLELNKKISPIQTKLDSVLADLRNAESLDKSNRDLFLANKSKFEQLKSKMDLITIKADKQTPTMILFALILWGFGVFVEVFIMLFPILKDLWREKREDKNHKTLLEKAEAELQGATEAYREELHNIDSLNYLLDYANNSDMYGIKHNAPNPHLLKDTMKWRKGNTKGKQIALSNSIVGAFLYAITMNNKNKKPFKSWSEIIQANILFANGKRGEEIGSNGKKRANMIESFVSHKNNIQISCLGSTSTALKIKNIGVICPQQEAIDFLVEKEKLSPEKFAPNKIKPKDIESLTLLFMSKYYPQLF